MGIVADIMAQSQDVDDDVDRNNVTEDSEYTGKIIKLLYRVHSRLGSGHKEAQYVRAFADELAQAGIPFRQGRPYPIMHGQRKVGTYKVDFLLEDKLAVDIKIRPDFYEQYFIPVLGYLKYSGVELALLACFRDHQVLVKRIIYSPEEN